MRTKRTVDQVLAEHGPAAELRLRPSFERAGVAYPPREIVLVGFKTERRLELWAPAGSGWKLVHAWPILGASGTVGPKLREGDRQVPEGSYGIASLNPNSRFHLSLELDYPNASDRARALVEGRDPGCEIFVHGSERSIGCLAIGDEAIEELFTLAARIGIGRVAVLILPNDPGADGELLSPPAPPAWLPELHASLRERLLALRAGASGLAPKEGHK